MKQQGKQVVHKGTVVHSCATKRDATKVVSRIKNGSAHPVDYRGRPID